MRRVRRLMAPPRGFTLVESLVALAIVAVALAAGSRAVAALTDNADRLRRVSAAQWCADNQLIEWRLRGQLPDIGDSRFSCTQLGLSLQGQMRVRPTPNPDFRRVEAVVGDTVQPRLLTLVTVMGRY